MALIVKNMNGLKRYFYFLEKPNLLAKYLSLENYKGRGYFWCVCPEDATDLPMAEALAIINVNLFQGLQLMDRDIAIHDSKLGENRVVLGK